MDIRGLRQDGLAMATVASWEQDSDRFNAKC